MLFVCAMVHARLGSILKPRFKEWFPVRTHGLARAKTCSVNERPNNDLLYIASQLPYLI